MAAESILVLDAAAGGQIAAIPRETDTRIWAHISDDGSRVVLENGSDGSILTFDADTGRRISALAYTWPDLRGVTVMLNADGTRVLVKQDSGSIDLFDSTTGARMAHLDDQFSGYSYFTEDGKRLTLAREDGTVDLWDAETGKLIRQLKTEKRGYRLGVARSPDSKLVVTTTGGPEAGLWNAETGEQIALLGGHTEEVNSVAFSADSNRILTLTRGGEGFLWDSSNAKLIAKLRVPTLLSNYFIGSNGIRIVGVGRQSQTTLFETGSWRKTANIPGEMANMRGAFNPHGHNLVSSLGKVAQVWDPETGKVLMKLEGHTDNINAAIFGPEGRLILTVSADRTACVWDAASGKLLVTLRNHPRGAIKGEFSPDGARVVTISEGGRAWLWEIASGKLIAELGRDKQYTDIIFNPDGTKLSLIGSTTISEFDAVTGRALMSVALLSGRKAGLDFVNTPFDRLTTNDDRSVIASQMNNTVWAMFWSTQDYLDAVELMLPRCLTLEERKAIGVEEEPPAWCIERAKWPFETNDWQDWLRFKRANANPPLPQTPQWQTWVAAHSANGEGTQGLPQ